MRPGHRWDGESANPIAAAIYGVVVSLALAYGISYLCVYFGVGAVSAGARHPHQSLSLAALSLYACQHVALIGSGTLADMGRVHATVNLPLTLWAVVPAISLIGGGLVAARARGSRGRWAVIAPAVASGVIYAVILALGARFVSAKFTSAALPAVSAPGINTEFNPLDIPFRPSAFGALGYGCLYGVIFSYLGALMTVRGTRDESVGKWWACVKAVLVVALVMQLILAIVGCAWMATSSRFKELDAAARPKYIQIIPMATGIAYAAVFGGKISYSAVPAAMPSAARAAEIGLYSGTASREGNRTIHRPASGFAWVAALVAIVMTLATGRLAVRYGSRDGSIPTAIRILLLQAVYFAILVRLCCMGWGISGQFTLFAGPVGDATLALAALVVFVVALIGAHRANLRFAAPLGGFPRV